MSSLTLFIIFRINMKFNTIIATFAVSFIATAALASGNHAGGHGNTDAIGKPGKAANVTRTINIDMNDTMRFTPSSIDVKQGETIKFIVKNSGKIKHEMTIGAMKDLIAHAEQMKKNPGMEHDEPNTASLAPGKTGEIIWQFTTAGKVDFACLEAGHFDAGMKGFVNVGGIKAATKASSHVH
jgi:uncharacterized cupredoxin-like copper-binding protein